MMIAHALTAAKQGTVILRVYSQAVQIACASHRARREHFPVSFWIIYLNLKAPTASGRPGVLPGIMHRLCSDLEEHTHTHTSDDT